MLRDVVGVLVPSEVQNILKMEQILTEIGTHGYVPTTVDAAFYCIGAADNFKDPVIMAIKDVGNTDTTAAIVGAMAGTWYGLEGIPEECKSVENFQLINILTEELINIEIYY